MWPALVDATLDAIRCDPRMVAIVEGLLGPEVKQLDDQIYFRLPGDPDSFAWHQDVMFRRPAAATRGSRTATSRQSW